MTAISDDFIRMKFTPFSPQLNTSNNNCLHNSTKLLLTNTKPHLCTHAQIALKADFCTEYSQLQHSIVCGRQPAQHRQHNMSISKQLNGNLKTNGGFHCKENSTAAPLTQFRWHKYVFLCV